MKLLRVLAVGTAFLCGIPVGLRAYDLGPIALFSHFTSFQQIMDIELLVRSCIGVLLWGGLDLRCILCGVSSGVS